ncbi:PAS domain S-box protein [Azospirillum sp. RWY-5-1]|uniref:histidine kinase n=1 Tax=Azospirillum oleiclasticum TaxID=2735135 RepID=A0ABX2TGC3_9PROT|nr:PAS domain S-box protein [Azospirillum oleiclasticum]NYZ16699.1 PAS domain S-box protein [Azospirillum oleiclasticum]NYZ23399.1 PAS domain S-box protein [Azospirillum oleiclasticum]
MDAAGMILTVLLTAVAAGAVGWWLRGRVHAPMPGANPSSAPGAGGDLTRAILDSAVDGLVIIDGRGTVQAFSRSAERMFGWRAEEVVGRNVSMLMPDPDRSAHDGYLQRYLQTGDARIIGKGRDVRGLRRDGTTFAMELAVGDSHGGGGERLFAGFVRDVGARKEIEERLRHSEARNRAILDAAADAIVTIDDKGRIGGFNRAAERIFGYAAAEVLGRNVSMLMPPPYRQEHDEYVARYLRTGEARIIGIGREVQGRHKDGRVFPVELAVGEGNLAGQRLFAGVLRDITDRKRAESALRTAKEEAERAALSKAKFLAAAGHDLRQPVQSLMFYAAALSARLPEGSERAMVTDMEGAIGALKSLLDSLLEVARLDAGVETASPVAFPADALLAPLPADYADAAALSGVELRVVLSSLTLVSDPALLARLLRQLVENAIRFSPSGRVLVGCRRAGSGARIEVRDTGVGMPADGRAEIFDDFVQLGNPERDRAKGLGLGLGIVRRIAGLLGHPVGLRSAPGRGSVFWVEVPTDGESPAAIRPPTLEPAGERVLGPRGAILLIDDEPVVLAGLALVLRGWGYDVIAATSVEEAMAALNARGGPPGLILADYRLREGHTGTEAIRRVTEHFRRPIPSLILTGETAPDRLREARDSGIDVLHKPVSPPVLLNALTRTMGNA